MATKTKPKGRKKVKKIKTTKRSKATPKRKASKTQSARKPSSKGASVSRTRKISRPPKKSTRTRRAVPRKERPSELKTPPSSLGGTTTIYESQEITAFGSPEDERDENETTSTPTISPLDEGDENLNDNSRLMD